MTTYFDIASRIAASLLLQDTELSISDIEALPFVEDREAADFITGFLLNTYSAELRQRPRKGSPNLNEWEDVIQLLPDETGIAQ